MIRHIDKERVVVYLFITLLLDFPIIYYVINKIIGLLDDSTTANYSINIGLLIYFVIMIFFTNFMRHIIMETNFMFNDNDKYFDYKTCLRKSTKIQYKNIKKILVCNEIIAFNGRYESIIIIQRGFRRNIFFQEFSMKKEDYTKLKIALLSHVNVITQFGNSNYIKPLLALFSF